MSTKFEGRLSRHDFIDDIVEPSSSSYQIKTIQNRNYSTFSSLPSLIHKTDNSPIIITNELHDRLPLTLPRSNSSLIMMSNDDRRKEIDLIIKHLYDGKLITTLNDDHPPLDDSEPLIHMLSKELLTTTTITDKENKNNVGTIDFLSHDGDLTALQRELQEKELDIIHLRKEIQELQLENKLLKSKVPSVYSNGYTTNNTEIDALRREKDLLQNELRTSQELIAKIQQEQHQNVIINRSNKIDEITLYQKEVMEKKIKTYEKQMRILINENEKLKQNFHHIERIITQLRGENDELQQKLIESKKRNNDLFYQEFNALRNDLKILKQRNNELFEENLRLQQKPNSNSKYSKINRSESPNISEASDSTNYLTTVNVEHYNTRPSTSIHRSATTTNGNNHHRITRHNSAIVQEEIHRNQSKSVDQQFNFRSSKIKRAPVWDEENIQTNDDIINYDDGHQVTDDKRPLSSHFRRSNYPIRRSVTLNESQHHSRRIINNDTNNQQDDRRQTRRNIETISPRRPYAPLSINDVRLNDIIKFSRPGGKISKGIVKYIGSLPDKTDQYLGIELEDEESKHDGIYQNKRLFQCKPNKGVFVAFNKVIMAWSEN